MDLGKRRRAWWGGILAAWLVAASGASVCAQQVPTQLDVVPPALVGGPWLNTPEGKPISLKARRGKVTLVHYWTFG
jgi:hypothetical protein